MAQQVIDRTATTRRTRWPSTRCWPTAPRGPQWSPLGSFELVEPGDGTARGLGAVPAVHHWPAQEPRAGGRVPAGRGLRLRPRGRPAVRDYRAVITLTPAEGGGTTINWHSTFRAKVPGTGWLYRRELGKFIRRTVEGLAAAAERARSS